MADGIASLRTAPGAGALAVVELRGHAARPFVSAHFQTRASGVVRHGRWGDLDDPLIVETEAGAELHLHGGRRIVERVLQDAEAFGFSVQRTGPALTGNATADLAFAETPAALRLLLAQPRLWHRAAERGVKVDAGDLTLRRLLAPAHVALVGAANVGKSTLANLLSGQAGSLAADVPGTTRDWVEQRAILLGEVPVILLDMPGVRSHADAVEQAAHQLAAPALAAADLIVEVRAPDVPPEPLSRTPHLTLWTKPDLAAPPAGFCVVNGVTGERLPDVERTIVAALGLDLAAPAQPLVWVDWQQDALQRDEPPINIAARIADDNL